MNTPFITLLVIASVITTANLAISKKIFQAGLFDQPNILHRSHREGADGRPMKSNCIEEFYNIFCSSSHGQNYIDSLSTCDESAIYEIYEIEHMCRKNLNGVHCGTLLSNTPLSFHMGGNCSETCTVQCQNIIVSNMEDIGCCFNDENFEFQYYLSKCQLPLPSPCPRSSLNIPSIIQDPSCSNFTDPLAASCDNSMPLIRCIQDTNNCGMELDDLKLTCSVRCGRYCFKESEDFHISMLFLLLDKASTECSTSTTCSLECNKTLGRIKSTLDAVIMF